MYWRSVTQIRHFPLPENGADLSLPVLEKCGADLSLTSTGEV